MIASNLIVVIRTAGERTFEPCKALVTKQVSEEKIFVVNERPFEAALRRCYQIGIDSEAEWMMTLDADVLLREGALEAFLTEAKQMPDHYLQVEGLIHDKLFGSYRRAGHRLYRTRYLRTALQNVPADGSELRPECSTLQRMASLGFPLMALDTVFGIHDYEQRFEDIYRKAFVHVHKHPEWIGLLAQRWKQHADGDPDFQIALRGLCDGLVSLEKARIDTRYFKQGAARAMETLGFREKAQPAREMSGFAFVQAVLEKAGPLPVLNSEEPRYSFVEKMRNHYCRIGAVKFLPFLAGATLSKVGNWMIEMVERK